jgi:hypothetical protein
MKDDDDDHDDGGGWVNEKTMKGPIVKEDTDKMISTTHNTAST